MKIAIFYHGLFAVGTPDNVLPFTCEVIKGQMKTAMDSGLVDAADFFLVGINGGQESEPLADLIIPRKAQRVFHGLDSRNENPTIVAMENWLPGHEGWYVLYFHAKGTITQSGGPVNAAKWRGCMMRNLIANWRQCVKDLDAGNESVGCHWMTYPATPKGQSIWAGTFFWAKSDFLLTLPSIMKRDRIKESGLKHYDSRYEAEVWIGNGPRLPRVKDYHPGWNPSLMHTCVP